MNYGRIALGFLLILVAIPSFSQSSSESCKCAFNNNAEAVGGRCKKGVCEFVTESMNNEQNNMEGLVETSGISFLCHKYKNIDKLPEILSSMMDAIRCLTAEVDAIAERYGRMLLELNTWKEYHEKKHNDIDQRLYKLEQWIVDVSTIVYKLDKLEQHIQNMEDSVNANSEAIIKINRRNILVDIFLIIRELNRLDNLVQRTDAILNKLEELDGKVDEIYALLKDISKGFVYIKDRVEKLNDYYEMAKKQSNIQSIQNRLQNIFSSINMLFALLGFTFSMLGAIGGVRYPKCLGEAIKDLSSFFGEVTRTLGLTWLVDMESGREASALDDVIKETKSKEELGMYITIRQAARLQRSGRYYEAGKKWKILADLPNVQMVGHLEVQALFLEAELSFRGCHDKWILQGYIISLYEKCLSTVTYLKQDNVLTIYDIDRFKVNVYLKKARAYRLLESFAGADEKEKIYEKLLNDYRMALAMDEGSLDARRAIYTMKLNMGQNPRKVLRRSAKAMT